MTVYGKHGKTIKLFSHPSHRPWKSPDSDSHIPTAATTTGKNIPKTSTSQGWAKTKCRSGPNQLAKRTGFVGPSFFIHFVKNA
jgi:hypothetical protein